MGFKYIRIIKINMIFLKIYIYYRILFFLSIYVQFIFNILYIY